MIDWNDRFMDMAMLMSTWSKDPSTQTGAVIVGEGKVILSTGYNGLPRGVHED